MFFLLLTCRLMFLILTIHGEDSFDCTGYEDDSFHPIYDADDCRHYWHCIYVDTVYMHAVRRVCPAGTEFDSELRQCETSSEVKCVPPKSPRIPTTTQAWKWRYSRLFSRKRRRTTTTTTTTATRVMTTRPHFIFDLEVPPEIETTEMMRPTDETTEKSQVLEMLPPKLMKPAALDQLTNNLRALILKHRMHKQIQQNGNLFKPVQPGQPNVEVEVYQTTRLPRRRTRTRTTKSMTTATTPIVNKELTTEPLWTSEREISTNKQRTVIYTSPTSPTQSTNGEDKVEMITSTSTTSTFVSLATTTVRSSLSPSPKAPISLQNETTTTRKIDLFGRLNSHSRRKNLTLYILTSDDHKIRQFSINQTRGILINCNQIRRRLLGRRLRQIYLSTSQSMIASNASLGRYLTSYIPWIISLMSLRRMT